MKRILYTGFFFFFGELLFCADTTDEFKLIEIKEKEREREKKKEKKKNIYIYSFIYTYRGYTIELKGYFALS